MTKAELQSIYRDYIACLNKQDWPMLACFVDNDVRHNGNQIGLAGYRSMLEANFADIPDLHFNIELLVAEPPHIASRLHFNCTPRGKFLNLNINGANVSFTENVFYKFHDQKIVQVWSVIDKTAIEAQLMADSDRSDA
ncbi:ester cyclase [Methylophilus sp. 3sh_L]|uniref:ester cyclase n=1 Tax=Methylophilus sp. 3sh_L TaxID=3377114 RepID=UPI00398EEB67